MQKSASSSLASPLPPPPVLQAPPSVHSKAAGHREILTRSYSEIPIGRLGPLTSMDGFQERDTRSLQDGILYVRTDQYVGRVLARADESEPSSLTATGRRGTENLACDQSPRCRYHRNTCNLHREYHPPFPKMATSWLIMTCRPTIQAVLDEISMSDSQGQTRHSVLDAG